MGPFSHHLFRKKLFFIPVNSHYTQTINNATKSILHRPFHRLTALLTFHTHTTHGSILTHRSRFGRHADYH